MVIYDGCVFGNRLFNRHIDDDEEILLIVHKHWLLGIKYLFMPFIAFLFSWTVFLFASYPLIFYIAAIASIGIIVWGLRNYYDYYLDAWIITDEGIIDVEWHGWFHRQSTRVLYSDIQGVSYEIQGIAGTILRFGTISVEKISTGSLFSLEYVKHPRAVEIVIMKNMEAYLHGKNMSDASHVQELLSQIVAREVSLEQFEDDEEEDYDDEEEYDEDDDE